MAMTQSMLLFIGGLATLTTLGMFKDWGDDWTGVLVAFTAAILWGVFGVSSFDVIIVRDATVTSVSSLPVVVIGVAFAIITGIYAIMELLYGFGGEASEIDTTLME